MTRKITIAAILSGALLAALVFLGGGLFGGVSAREDDLYSQLNLFNEVLRHVMKYYVDDVPPDSLIGGAIRGMLEQLDPHTNYVDPKRFQRMDERNRGSYSGVGISFAIRNGNLTVISALEGGPSERLGIRAGDIITHIDGKSAFGIKESEVFERLRGPKGTKVRVTIRREGEPEPLEFEIVRDDIRIESVPYAFLLESGIGYIRLSRFSSKTSEELEEALRRLEDEGMEQLILDLRGNSGGYLNAAVDVADKFLGGGKMIVYTKGRVPGSNEEYKATDAATHPYFPMVVLIDHASASASEIVSGAIQDWDRGLVAGRTSFGKGLVQRQYRLPDGGALLLTVARYYTPSGRLIQRPYSPGEREEYYRHAGDEGDSTAERERPVFHTLIQKRPVYGGGGISPDVEIEEVYRRSRTDARLDIDRVYFDYVNKAVGDGTIAWKEDFDSFLRRFEVDDRLLERFVEFVKADSVEVEPDSIYAHRDEIALSLKAEIAHHLWGDDERFQVIIRPDPVLKRALELLPEAEALLTESLRLEEKRAAAR